MSSPALAAVLLALVSSCALAVSFDDLPHAPRSLRGSVSGLDGATVLLELATRRMEIGDGPFSFPDSLAYGSTYSLGIAAQPAGRYCTIRGGRGDVGPYDVTGVEVRCELDPPRTCDGGCP